MAQAPADADPPPGSFTPQARRQVDEALAEGLRRAAPPAPAAAAAAPAGERPYERQPGHGPDTGAFRQPGHGPDTGAFRQLGPTWHPAPAPVTAPMPAVPADARVPLPAEALAGARPAGEEGHVPLVRPYAAGMPAVKCTPLDKGTEVEIAAEPVIGDSLPSPVAQAPAGGPANLLPDSVPYCGPGWAGRLMSTRVRRGEWEDVIAIVERGWGRNAAEEAAAHRHVREMMPDRARRLCASLGEPGLADALLYRVREYQAAGGAR